MRTLKQLEQARANVAALKTDRRALADMPALSRDELRQRLGMDLAQAQASAAHAVGVRLAQLAAGERGGDPLLSMGAGGRVLDLAPLLAFAIGPEELLQRIEPLLAAVPEGMPSAERSRRLAELDAQILAAEITEERVVEALEAAGVPVQRRADADPRAVLALPEVRS